MKVEVEKSGPVSTIILNRPERRNAVDGETAAALAEAFRTFEADATAKVAVLWGRGGHFCAGADLKSLAQEGKEVFSLSEAGDGPLGPTRMRLSKPVIAAVAGYAVAGGLELALWCDLRVIEPSTVFGVFCRQWGVPLIDGGTVRLPRLIGMSRALDLILTGREMAAEEAMATGLGNRLAPDGQGRQVAEGLALQLAEFPQTCLRNDRTSVYDQADLDLPEAFLNEFRLGMKSLGSGEALAGAKRFMEEKGQSEE